MKDLFSVVVLIYNNSEYLNQCLESVLIQDYASIELIIVDDCSRSFNRDDIVSYLESNKKENLVNYVVYQNEKNFGTVKSANGAIKKASGRFIKLLAADDALYDWKSLSHAAEALLASPDGIIAGDVMRCDAHLEPIAEYHKNLLDNLNHLKPFEVFRLLCIHNDIVAGGVFFTKSFFEKYGYFDESYRLLEDWPTWLTVTKKGCRILHSPFYAVRYRSNGGVGTSVNPMYMADKQRVLTNIIIPAKREIGYFWYAKARISFMLINSSFVRTAYGAIFRKGKE